MGLSLQCAYCGKPLVDADHARQHAVNQCNTSPTKKLADALEAMVVWHGTRPAKDSGPSKECLCQACAEARAVLREVGRMQ